MMQGQKMIASDITYPPSGYGWAPKAGSIWRRQGGNPQLGGGPDFVELIVTISQTDDGNAASNQLREDGSRFAIEYIESLSDRLSNFDMEDFLARQSYTFPLVRVPAARKGRAMRGLVDWYNGESGR